MIDPGERDREVTLQFKTKGKSAKNEPTETWGGNATEWARVRPLTGAESYSALGQQWVPSEMLVFRILHRADVRADTARVLFEGRTYDVRRVVEVGLREELDVFGETVSA